MTTRPGNRRRQSSAPRQERRSPSLTTGNSSAICSARTLQRYVAAGQMTVNPYGSWRPECAPCRECSAIWYSRGRCLVATWDATADQTSRRSTCKDAVKVDAWQPDIIGDFMLNPDPANNGGRNPARITRLSAMPTPLRLLTRGSWSESQRLLRDPPQGDRRRHAAAGRRRCRTGVGELAVVGRLPRGVGVRVRTGVPAPAPVRLGVGGRRAVGDLLLRRRAGTQARVRRRRPARSAPRGAADRGRHRRHDRSRPPSTSRSTWPPADPKTSTGGRSRSPPTSRSRLRCSRCCPPTCRLRCAPSC